MRQPINAQHKTDENGNPTGGTTTGLGIEINWQDGPLGRGDDMVEPSGAFVEGVLAAALERLQFYNGGKFNCAENTQAILKIEEALHWLDHRHAERERRQVQGLHIV